MTAGIRYAIRSTRSTPRLACIAALAWIFLAAPAALADPPHAARGKGPPAHAGGPGHRDAPPPGWQKQAWRRGDHLPMRELDDRYWIDEPLRYHLKAAPPGHRWVRQSDTEFLLVEVATGLVLDALSR